MNRDLERFLNEAFEGHARLRASIVSETPTRAELLHALVYRTSRIEQAPGRSAGSPTSADPSPDMDRD
jgi:hypothetical protein